MRKWREIHSLHFLIFYLFPPSLSISYIKNGLILSQNVEYVTFVTTVTKNLAYALWESNSGSNSLRESSASFASLAPIYGHWDYPLQSSKCPIEIYSWISKKWFHEIERPKKNWYTEHEIYLHVFLALLWSWMWKRSDCREGLCLPDGSPQCGSWLRCQSLPCTHLANVRISFGSSVGNEVGALHHHRPHSFVQLFQIAWELMLPVNNASFLFWFHNFRFTRDCRH